MLVRRLGRVFTKLHVDTTDSNPMLETKTIYDPKYAIHVALLKSLKIKWIPSKYLVWKQSKSRDRTQKSSRALL